MRIALKETQLGLRNSFTRIPFRYGSACLTSCPQAILRILIEFDGKQHRGYSGDCLPPGWFDKSPEKDYQQQIKEMLAAISLAEQTFLDELGKPGDFFPAWMRVYSRMMQAADENTWEPLLASFGLSMVERAVLDAMARAAQVSFATAVRENLYGLDPGKIHQDLAGLTVAAWLPERPSQTMYVRHTVGLADPLTAADIPKEELLNDGFPQSLEDYITQTGIRYFKIKVSNDQDHSLQRLASISDLIERHCTADYQVTLDGNEQFARAEDFIAFLEASRSHPKLEKLLAATLAIEQPLERKIALDPTHAMGIREICQFKRVIIDESDSTMDAYPRAIELGYRGTSSKNCKGPIKSLMNAGLTWLHNARGSSNDYLITGEDLCCVGIVPVQADLCLVATMGLTHVERNGHHYHRGLSYLPTSEQQKALAAHGDFYTERQGVVGPRLNDGKFEIGSLQCIGFGFSIEPDFDSLQTPTEWEFASLGL